MDDPKGAVARPHEPCLLGELAPRAGFRILAIGERPGGHLPRRYVPRMAPLPHEHRVAVVEVRHDKSRIGALDDRVQGLDAVGKANRVVAHLECARRSTRAGAGHREWPSSCGMAESTYWRTTTATAAA